MGMRTKRLQSIAQIVTTLEAIVIIVTVVLSVGSVIWALVTNLGAMSIPIGMVTLVTGLYALIWVKGYKERRGIPRKDLKKVIEGWLFRAFRNIQDATDVDYTFRVQSNYGGDNTITVGQRKDASDAVFVAQALGLSGHHVGIYAALSEGEKERLVRFLITQVAGMGVIWENFRDPLDSMGFVLVLAYDASFTQTRLMQSIFVIQRAITIIRQAINLQLNPTTESQGTSGTTDQSTPDKEGSRN